MAIAVKIDFENTYPIESISADLRASTFFSVLQEGSVIPLKIEISDKAHELLPNVYNLAFGPTNQFGHIDDKAQLKHQEYSRVFSTILFSALTYLNNNKDHFLGIDGSDNLRAHLYYRFLQRNYEYLNQHFKIFGLKYYVRITRFGKTQYEDPFDFLDVLPYPTRIEAHENIDPELMYNYFIFSLQDHR